MNGKTKEEKRAGELNPKLSLIEMANHLKQHGGYIKGRGDGGIRWGGEDE